MEVYTSREAKVILTLWKYISYFCIFALVQTVYHIGILLIKTCGIFLLKN